MGDGEWKNSLRESNVNVLNESFFYFLSNYSNFFTQLEVYLLILYVYTVMDNFKCKYVCTCKYTLSIYFFPWETLLRLCQPVLTHGEKEGDTDNKLTETHRIMQKE